MMKLERGQHARILGYALIAYGTYLVLNALGTALPIMLLTSKELTANTTSVLVPQILSAVLYFVICIIAGLDIRDQKPASRIPGLIFVCIAIGSFPLGTILSAYVLIYLFVILPDGPEEDLSSSAIAEKNEQRQT